MSTGSKMVDKERKVVAIQVPIIMKSMTSLMVEFRQTVTVVWMILHALEDRTVTLAQTILKLSGKIEEKKEKE